MYVYNIYILYIYCIEDYTYIKNTWTMTPISIIAGMNLKCSRNSPPWFEQSFEAWSNLSFRYTALHAIPLQNDHPESIIGLPSDPTWLAGKYPIYRGCSITIVDYQDVAWERNVTHSSMRHLPCFPSRTWDFRFEIVLLRYFPFSDRPIHIILLAMYIYI